MGARQNISLCQWQLCPEDRSFKLPRVCRPSPSAECQALSPADRTGGVAPVQELFDTFAKEKAKEEHL